MVAASMSVSAADRACSRGEGSLSDVSSALAPSKSTASWLPSRYGSRAPAGGPTMTHSDLSDLSAGRDVSRPLRGYLASPAGTGPWPALVMIHVSFGLDAV